MTYAEQHGRTRADWLSFLQESGHKLHVIELAVRNARYWNSNPLAHMEGSHLILRCDFGIPNDKRLTQLCLNMYCHMDAWYKFYGHRRGDMAQGSALFLYHSIEQRLRLLLQENKVQSTLNF